MRRRHSLWRPRLKAAKKARSIEDLVLCKTNSTHLFEKQQSSEAEKFKVLDMMARRLSDELTVERISQADITERNTREIKIVEHSLQTS